MDEAGTTFGALGKAFAVGISVSTICWLAGMALTSALGGRDPERNGVGPPARSFLGVVISVWIIASTCEEVFYRGLQQRFLAPLSALGLGGVAGESPCRSRSGR